MADEQVILNKTFRANSFEVGVSGKRFKIYFEDSTDLKNQIEELKKQGFKVEE